MGSGASSKYAATRSDLAGASDCELQAQLKGMDKDDRSKLKAECVRLQSLMQQVDEAGRECWQCYLDRYPDLQKAFGPKNVTAASEHFLKNGKKEGRDNQCSGSCSGIVVASPADVVPGAFAKTPAGSGVCGPYNDFDQTVPVRLESGEVVDLKIGDLSLKQTAPANLYSDIKKEDGALEIPKTEMRAMSVQQLKDVVSHIQRRCETEGWYNFTKFGTRGELINHETINLYAATDWLLKPATKARKCSYVELVATKEQRPHWFVSHWWGEPVLLFVKCIEQHAMDRNYRRPNWEAEIPGRLYWVCAYANNQWALAGDVVEDPGQSSFRKAIDLAQGTVSVLDMNTICYTRVWCGYEVYTSVSDPPNAKFLYDMYTLNPTDGAAVGILEGFGGCDQAQASRKEERENRFPPDVLKKAMDILIQNCAASVESDRVHILNCIAKKDLNAPPPKEHESFDMLNKTLRALYGMSMYRQTFQSGESLDGLNKVLSESSVDNLFLNLSTTTPKDTKLVDSHLIGLGQSMPKTIANITLTLSNRFSKLWKTGPTDAGVLALASGFSPALRDLTLNFTNNVYITDVGFEAVMANLPDGIYNVNMIWDDTCISNFNIKSLPQTLTKVQLSFTGTEISDKAVQSLMAALPMQLALNLNFNGCPKLTVDAVKAVATKINDKTGSVAINFLKCACGDAEQALEFWTQAKAESGFTGRDSSSKKSF